MIEFLLKDSEKRVTEFTVKDSFLVADAAPVTSPRTAEPGPGTLTIVDTEDKFSIAGGKLVCAGGKAAPAYGDPGAWGGAVSRAAGIAFLLRINLDDTSNNLRFGWDQNQSASPGQDGFHLAGPNLSILDAGVAGGILGTLAATTDYDFAVVLRTAGAFGFIKGGAFANWTLLWVYPTANTATIYSSLNNYNRAFNAGSFRNLNLPTNGYAIWADDYGIATDRLAGAVSSGSTYTHEADCIMEFEITTLSSGASVQVNFRRQDAGNTWAIYVASNGTVQLIERVGESNTARMNSSAGAVSGGERIVVVAEGNVYTVYYDNTLIGTYTDPSSYFITETGGKLNSLGTGGAVSDIVAWPRTLASGGAGLGRGATA